MKKTRGQKSRATVPLIKEKIEDAIGYLKNIQQGFLKIILYHIIPVLGI
jgi:hypothetical protein